MASKKTGNYSLDPNIFPEEPFAASKITDRDVIDASTQPVDAVITEVLVGDKSPGNPMTILNYLLLHVEMLQCK